jgi:hypothetical protein
VHKESNVKAIAQFMDDNSSSMRDFLNYVCTKFEDHTGNRPHHYDDAIPDSRLQVMHSIHRQHSRRRDLEREAVGSLPHLIDIPQQLAILASLLAAHCQKFDPDSFNKRGVVITDSSLQRLATLTWQALAIRDHAFRLMGQVIRRL